MKKYFNLHYQPVINQQSMKTVQILGVRGYEQTNLLHSNVMQALGELKMEASVEEVTDVDDLVRMNISGIPALIINGKIASQRSVPDVEHLKMLFKDSFNSKAIAMKKILVPVDFSETSKGALRYALTLAKNFDSNVQIIYFFLPTTAPEYGYMDNPIPELLEASEARMAQFMEEVVPKDLADRVKSSVEIGFPGEEVTNMTNEGLTDFVVMGTTGESGWLKQMFGSLSLHVAQHARCPVLLVPNGLTFNPYRRILFATNYEGGDERMVQQVSNFANSFESDIHLVHVREGQKEDSLVKETLLEGVFKKEAPNRNVYFANVESDTVIHGLEEYARKNEVGLVALATKHRNFVENILHKSLTKQMLFNTKVPLLVLHY